MPKKAQKSLKNLQSEPIAQENMQPQLEIDYEGIYANQKKLQILCQNAQHNKNIEYICYQSRKFSKVKYKQNIYQVGEYVHLYEPTQTLPYVVKIHEIIRIPNQQIAAILKVQWLLRKNDLPPKYQKYIKHFSTAEVFPSGDFNYVLIESIMRKCYVIQNSQYEFLQNAGDNIHFSRAVYDFREGQLNPHPQQWVKQCYCMAPVNPDLAYTLCQKCQHWFHNDCVKDSKLLEAEAFVCENCATRQ